METLKVWSEKISQNLQDRRNELETQKRRIIETLNETTEEFKEASAQGDRSENAAFTEALSKLSMNNVALSMLDTQLKTIEDKVHEELYNPIDLVIEYATVKLELLGTGREFIFKVYPAGVSDVQRGILSLDSAVGKAIRLREKDEVVTIEHRITGDPLRYKIVDIY